VIRLPRLLHQGRVIVGRGVVSRNPTGPSRESLLRVNGRGCPGHYELILRLARGGSASRTRKGDRPAEAQARELGGRLPHRQVESRLHDDRATSLGEKTKSRTSLRAIIASVLSAIATPARMSNCLIPCRFTAKPKPRLEKPTNSPF